MKSLLLITVLLLGLVAGLKFSLWATSQAQLEGASLSVLNERLTDDLFLALATTITVAVVWAVSAFLSHQS